MTKPILEIENLNAFFPGKQVLHDVSLTVQTGRKLALVGESGSGKTVLAHIFFYKKHASVAQSVEQRTENPCVDSSILS